MSTKRPPTVVFKGRFLGIAVLVAAQVIVGFIHVVFGLWFLSASAAPLAGITAFGPVVYRVYTIVFGLLTLGFALSFWLQKPWGWCGIVAVSAFVIGADSLTLLNLPSIPGIPKFAGFGEISYSVIVVLYLLQEHVRTAYRIHF